MHLVFLTDLHSNGFDSQYPIALKMFCCDKAASRIQEFVLLVESNLSQDSQHPVPDSVDTYNHTGNREAHCQTLSHRVSLFYPTYTDIVFFSSTNVLFKEEQDLIERKQLGILIKIGD